MDAVATRIITRPLTQSEMVTIAKSLANTMSDRDRIALEKKYIHEGEIVDREPLS